ncbi:MAG TPA: DUF790 family protein [Ktedonosporobacter sp.]|jgi:predicted nuclease of restriction endonuclease-like RecB superfamily|nr:DUF790 family protein [Ktedonosporobacter sp.]
MLTSDLIKPFVQQRGAEVHVDLLDETDERYLHIASTLITTFQGLVGQTRSTWWQAREALEGTRTDYMRLRGLAKILEDEATFSPQEGDYTPAQVRRHLFEHGPVFATPDVFHPHSRQEAIATVAGKMASSVEQIEALFFADRPEEYRLTHPGPHWTPLTLLRRYNLELARGVLYRATVLRIEIHDNFKDIWRYLKLFKIMFWCEELPEGGYRLTLSGPMSEFILTERYGIAFAQFMPALLLGERWRMTARLKPFSEKIPLDDRLQRQQIEAALPRYSLDHTCGLFSHYRRAALYDSALERTFASEFTDFEEKFGGSRGHWRLLREQEVLALGGTVMIPDFQLVHSLDERRTILIELVGYWSPTYLRNKVTKVRSANCPHLLLLVYEELNVTRESFGEVASEIVFFKQKPIIKEIMPVIEAMAERVYGPLTKTPPPAMTLEEVVAAYQAQMATRPEEWMGLTEARAMLASHLPMFSPRLFGCKDLPTFFKKHEEWFEVRRAPCKGRPLQIRLRKLPA